MLTLLLGCIYSYIIFSVPLFSFFFFNRSLFLLPKMNLVKADIVLRLGLWTLPTTTLPWMEVAFGSVQVIPLLYLLSFSLFSLFSLSLPFVFYSDTYCLCSSMPSRLCRTTLQRHCWQMHAMPRWLLYPFQVHFDSSHIFSFLSFFLSFFLFLGNHPLPTTFLPLLSSFLFIVFCCSGYMNCIPCASKLSSCSVGAVSIFLIYKKKKNKQKKQ